ncbi:arsenate reductase family protein [uncultured Enterococcus sp.]|uniref:arsenate reductase family protein n=1 Tax=uncultured Enterococcus sp. TaxID=167972 RepID=UPI0025CBA45B|nr:arsenate reductase family protein [uncultured Enterococcus sp.]
MVTVYGYPKCSTCKKAMVYLSGRLDNVELIDIVTQTPSATEIKNWMTSSELPLRRFFNTSGKRYRELGLKDQLNDLSLEEASEILASDGMLLKRPIILKNDEFVLNGFKEEVYEGIVEEWKKNA